MSTATESLASLALQLVESHPLHKVLDEPSSAFLPVSGICLVEDACYVIFRDRRDVARCRVQPPHPSRTLRWFRQAPCHFPPGYAGLTFDPNQTRFYALADAVPAGDDTCWPCVDTYDDSLRFVERRPVDFHCKGDQTGLVSVGLTTHTGQALMFALCGGYKCKRGKAGRKPGGGRIHVFRPGTSRWEHVCRINLPKSVPFAGFSSLALLEDRLLVVAQGSPEVWIGRLDSASLDVTGEGTIYELPHDEQGDPLVGAVTGVAWVNQNTILVTANGASPQFHVLSVPG